MFVVDRGGRVRWKKLRSKDAPGGGMGRVLSGGVGLALTEGPSVGHWKGIRSDTATCIGGGTTESSS